VITNFFLSEKKQKIPQNLKENIFFEIKKSDWENSIDVLIDSNHDVNLYNLYYILKSYFKSDEILIKSIYIISEDMKTSDKKNTVLTNVNIYAMQKSNFLNFKIWFSKEYDNNLNYLINSKKFGLRIIFIPECIHYLNSKKIDILEKNRPIFPWKKKLLDENDEKINFILEKQSSVIFLKKEIEKYVKEIEHLKKIINSKK